MHNLDNLGKIDNAVLRLELSPRWNPFPNDGRSMTGKELVVELLGLRFSATNPANRLPTDVTNEAVSRAARRQGVAGAAPQLVPLSVASFHPAFSPRLT
jgi:hypothetical protein